MEAVRIDKPRSQTKSASKYILVVLLSIPEMDLTKCWYSVSKGKDDKKLKADETDSKEKNTNRRGKKIQRSWLDELIGLVYESDTSTSHAETNVIYCQICRDNKVTAEKPCSMFWYKCSQERHIAVPLEESVAHKMCRETFCKIKKQKLEKQQFCWSDSS